MKKITSMLLTVLALFTVLSFASCNTLSTVEVINGAIEKTAALNEYEAKMDITIDMAMEGMTMNIPMSIVAKIKDAKSENPITSAEMTTKILGQKMSVTSYSDGNYVYVSQDGEGYKMSIEEADGEYDYAEDVDDMLKELPEDLIKDVTLEEGEDGEYKLTVNVPNETFNELYGDLIDGMSESSVGEIVDEISVSDCKIVVTVKDGYVSSYDITFKMEMAVEGMNTSSSVTAKVEFVNPGKSVSIIAPDGYEDFEDLGGFDWQ